MKDCTKDWVMAELSEGEEPEIPFVGQSVALYCCPRDGTWAWLSDIGSVYVESEESDAPLWGSAFGVCSGLDGLKFEDILKDYVVCFAAVPALELGRFPSPLGISHKQSETNYRARINRILDNLE